MGLALKDIQSVISNKEKYNAADIIDQQIARIKKDIAVQAQLLKELIKIKDTLSKKKASP